MSAWRHPSTWLPWAITIAGDGVGVWRGYLAAWWYRQWLHSRVFDPSGAELDYLNAQTEAVFAVIARCVAAVGVTLVVRAMRKRQAAMAAADAAQPIAP